MLTRLTPDVGLSGERALLAIGVSGNRETDEPAATARSSRPGSSLAARPPRRTTTTAAVAATIASRRIVITASRRNRIALPFLSTTGDPVCIRQRTFRAEAGTGCAEFPRQFGSFMSGVEFLEVSDEEEHRLYKCVCRCVRYHDAGRSAAQSGYPQADKQKPAAQADKEKPAAKPHTMTGCLEKGADATMFRLTNVEGTGPKTVELHADAGKKLAAHVGHKMAITGGSSTP